LEEKKMNDLILYPARIAQIQRIIADFTGLHNRPPDTVDMALHLDMPTTSTRKLMVRAIAAGAITETHLSPRSRIYHLKPITQEANMDTENQKRIVTELLTSVGDSIQHDIDTGKIPPEWDGWELRQLAADRFTNQSRLAENKPRLKAYRNTVLVKGL
jgi:hypothetical protein